MTDEHTMCGKLGPVDSRDRLITRLQKELEETKADLSTATDMLVLALKLNNGSLSALDLATVLKALR